MIRVLHLEDGATKHTTIARVVRDSLPAKVDWARDVATGIERIREAIANGEPYDVAITDMHYPLASDEKADWTAGDVFTAQVKEMGINLPVIICSTHNMINPDAFGCVWFNEINDWETELIGCVRKATSREAQR